MSFTPKNKVIFMILSQNLGFIIYHVLYLIIYYVSNKFIFVHIIFNRFFIIIFIFFKFVSYITAILIIFIFIFLKISFLHTRYFNGIYSYKDIINMTSRFYSKTQLRLDKSIIHYLTAFKAY